MFPVDLPPTASSCPSTASSATAHCGRRVLLVVNPEDGRILFSSPGAQDCLEDYFPDFEVGTGALPVALAAWVSHEGARPAAPMPCTCRREQTAENGGGSRRRRLVVHPFSQGAPGRAGRGEEDDEPAVHLADRRLEARLLANLAGEGAFGAGERVVAIQLEEVALPLPATPERLMTLGLTSREAEVLFWVAHGKSNPEVAMLLGAAVNTVKKHMQNLTEKLGVESRLAAAICARESLERPTSRCPALTHNPQVN